MWEVVLPNVPVQGWVVDPDEHGFFDGSCHIVVFSVQDFEIVHSCSMATGSLVMEEKKKIEPNCTITSVLLLIL